MVPQPNDDASIEIILAGISHDLHRQVLSVSGEIDEWLRKRAKEFGKGSQRHVTQIRDTMLNAKNLAQRLRELVDEADDDKFSNVTEMLAAFDRQVARPLRAAGRKLRRISTETGGMSRSWRGVELQNMANGYERAADLLRSLSKFAELGTSPNYASVNLSKELNKVRLDLKGLLVREEQPYQQVDIRGSTTITTDRALVSAIVSNLLTNAVVHRDKRRRLSIRIRITKYSPNYIVDLFYPQRIDIHSPTDWACIEVRDNGPGIAPDEREKIFQLFKQGQKALRTSRGSGVGLAVVIYCLDILGGCVQVQSSLGRGSVFRIFLPSGPVDATVPPILPSRELGG